MSLEKESTDFLDLLNYIFIAIASLFGAMTAYFSLKKSKEDKAADKRIVDLLDHPFFDTLRTEQLKIATSYFGIDNEQKIVAIKRYLNLKISWWYSIMTQIIQDDCMYKGHDILSSPVAFGKWVYADVAFGGREKYFLDNDVSPQLLKYCHDLITADVVSFTHETVGAILSTSVGKTRYEIADSILHVLSQGIMIDNKAIIKHAKTFGDF